MPGLPRLAWLEIDTAALAANLEAIRSLLPTGTGVAAVVKSDGYGHGLEVTARTFALAGAGLLCVATLDEGLALRAAGIRHRTAVLFAVPVERLEDAVAADLELVVATEAGTGRLLERWTRVDRAAGARAGAGSEQELRIHLEIDTGLARAGVPPEVAGRVAAAIAGTPGARLVGLWSHLASSHDAALSAAQVERFGSAVRGIEAAGVSVPDRHVAASGALFAATAPAYEIVRPGLALYGELSDGLPLAEGAAEAAAALQPALTLKARPLRIERLGAGTAVGYGGLWVARRESLLATLPLGYGDGYARAYGQGSGGEGAAEVLVRGRRAPVVGSIAMDATMVDVTDIPDVEEADEVVLLGAQGADRIAASELARLRTTIVYEVLATMATRLARVYHAPAGLLGLRTLEGEAAHPERGAEL